MPKGFTISLLIFSIKATEKIVKILVIKATKSKILINQFALLTKIISYDKEGVV